MAETNSYRVSAVCFEGKYVSTVMAPNPIDAALRVMERLGFGEVPASPFAIFVTPRRPPRGKPGAG
jgi:hypothetical protein